MISPTGKNHNFVSKIQGKGEATFRYPDTSTLPGLSTNAYLQALHTTLPPPIVLGALAALLQERRLVITSRSLALLTACTHALAALLYPLHWQVRVEKRAPLCVFLFYLY